MKIYYKKSKQTETDIGKMTGVLKPIVERYKDLDEAQQFDFKRTARNLVKWYSYISQIVRMFDKELQKEYVFISYLEKMLPRVSADNIAIEDKLKLEFYKLEETYKGDISFNPVKEDQVIYNPKSINPESELEKDELLENIIKKVNERFSGMFTDGDRGNGRSVV